MSRKKIMLELPRSLIAALLVGFASQLLFAGGSAFTAFAQLQQGPGALVVAPPEAINADGTRALYRTRRLTPVRAEPRYDSQPLGFLSPGQQIHVKTAEGLKNWFSVESRDGLNGFVIGSLIHPDREATLIDLAFWPEKPDGTITLEATVPFEIREIAFSAPTAEDKRQIQRALVYLGHYDGVVDGQFGRRTLNAIRDFQRAGDMDSSGQLDFIQYYDLIQTANERLLQHAMLTFRDVKIGYRVDYPNALLPSLARLGNDGWRFSDRNGEVELSIIVSRRGADLRTLYDQLTASSRAAYSVQTERVVVVADGDGDNRSYHVAKRRSDVIVQARLTYPGRQSSTWGNYAAVLYNSLSVADN
jgi:hypothetical protein